MFSQLLSTLALATLASAHFVLLWPPTAGFDEEKEPTPPCGGATLTINDNSPDVQVDRFAISIQNLHPAAEWTFRGTTNTEAPYEFTDIVPVVNSTGIGNFCLEDMRVPSGWAGQPGIIQVIDNSADGVLYQCAAVNFVTGSNNTAGPGCRNASSVDALWANEGGSSSGLMTTASSSASASVAASSSSSGVAAIVTGVGSFVGGLGLLAAGFAL